MSEIRVDTISEKTSANGVAVDGVTIKDGGIAATLASTITTADNTDTLSLISTDADGSSGPNLKLYRNSGSPADGDTVGDVGFTGRNDNSQDVEYARIFSTISDASDGTEDGRLDVNMMIGGTQRSIMKVFDTDIIFNDDSQDINFRVESNDNITMFMVNGGNNLVGIGADPDLGTGLHIKIADSGATATAHGDELVIEDGTSGANVGISILCNANGEGRINFGDSDDNDIGGIYYEHDGDRMEFNANNTEILRLSSSEVCFNEGSGNIDFRIETNNNANAFLIDGANDTIALNDTAPDTSEGGICFNQLGATVPIITLKSSAVAHGMTDNRQTDTWAAFSQASDNDGGLQMEGYSEGRVGMKIAACCNTEGNTRNANGLAGVIIESRLKSSNSFAGHTSDENIIVMRNHNDAVFFFDSDGDFHADNSSTTFDAYDDAHLVRAYDLSHGKGVIDSKFDKFVAYNHEKLADLKLVGREDDGTPNNVINVTGMQRLHNGAIWQQYEKTERLANAMYELAKAAVGEEKANEILEQNEIKLLN